MYVFEAKLQDKIKLLLISTRHLLKTMARIVEFYFLGCTISKYKLPFLFLHIILLDSTDVV